MISVLVRTSLKVLYHLDAAVTILAYLRSSTLLLKHMDVNKLTTAFLKFVWRGKRLRIALKKLMMPVLKGGLNLPDIRAYNLAGLLRHSADWIKGTFFSSNLALESDLVSPWPLTGLLHTKLSSLPRIIRSSLLIKDTIAALKLCRKSFQLSHSLSKHMPLWNHPEFPQGIDNKQFSEWRNKGILHFNNSIDTVSQRYLTFSELQAQFQLSNAHYLP